MKISIIGAGAWGTTLAVLAASNGHDVTLWSRRAEQVLLIKSLRENVQYLPGIKLPNHLCITSNLEDTHSSEFVFMVVPSTHMMKIADLLPRALPIINCAKGLDQYCQPLTTGLIQLGFSSVAVLSGPNLAFEIARGLPAVTVVASSDDQFVQLVQLALSTSSFSISTSQDVIGVSLAGALKNVIALGAGLVNGLELGENASAAFITRGLHEITQFATAHGALKSTMYGIAGLGDLMLSCHAIKTRNRDAGQRIAKGLPLLDNTVEGILTAARVVAWAQAEKIQLPVCQTVHSIINGRAKPLVAFRELFLQNDAIRFD